MTKSSSDIDITSRVKHPKTLPSNDSWVDLNNSDIKTLCSRCKFVSRTLLYNHLSKVLVLNSKQLIMFARALSPTHFDQ